MSICRTRSTTPQRVSHWQQQMLTEASIEELNEISTSSGSTGMWLMCSALVPGCTPCAQPTATATHRAIEVERLGSHKAPQVSRALTVESAVRIRSIFRVRSVRTRVRADAYIGKFCLQQQQQQEALSGFRLHGTARTRRLPSQAGAAANGGQSDRPTLKTVTSTHLGQVAHERERVGGLEDLLRRLEAHVLHVPHVHLRFQGTSNGQMRRGRSVSQVDR